MKARPERENDDDDRAADAQRSARRPALDRMWRSAHARCRKAARSLAGEVDPGRNRRANRRQEDDMAGDEKALRRDLGAERLGERQHDSADQRAPHRTGAADHHRLEREDELRRAGIGIERGAHREQRAGKARR